MVRQAFGAKNMTLVQHEISRRQKRLHEPDRLPQGRQTGSLKIVKHIEQLTVIFWEIAVRMWSLNATNIPSRSWTRKQGSDELHVTISFRSFQVVPSACNQISRDKGLRRRLCKANLISINIESIRCQQSLGPSCWQSTLAKIRVLSENTEWVYDFTSRTEGAWAITLSMWQGREFHIPSFCRNMCPAYSRRRRH